VYGLAVNLVLYLSTLSLDLYFILKIHFELAGFGSFGNVV
jgi:hypothetical protein